MKRSQINALVQDCIAFFDSMNFRLPAFALWTIDEWRKNRSHIGEIARCGLGWDITDFGSGDFERIGLMNFNLRNGVAGQTLKQYCEKIMIVGELQITPLHTHNSKKEDIINRGGGNLVMRLYNGDDRGGLAQTPVIVSIDAVEKEVKPGTQVILHPGESIFVEPGVIHEFYGEPSKGRVLVGEVSSVNDDNIDNVFYDAKGRFPQIEEDEPPRYLLVRDYHSLL